MKKTLTITLVSLAFVACKEKKSSSLNNYVYLRSDTVNIVKATDPLAILESTCRGCAYEESTTFAISDSAGRVKLLSVSTTDNNPANVDGGSVRKDILLSVTGTGITTFRLYKFWEAPQTAEDSTQFTTYTIDVRN